ncbi:MAG TPA: S8 family serine peptidase [bacterium]
MKFRSFFSTYLLAAFLVSFSIVSNSAEAQNSVGGGVTPSSGNVIQYDTTGMIPDSVIVEFDSYAEVRSAQTFDTYPGVIWDRSMSSRPVARFRITDGSSPIDTILRLRPFSGIREVYPNYRRSASFTPNDPYFTLQSEEINVAQIPAAWDIQTGSSNVLVAVIDTGVDTTHPDLLPNLVLPGINVREPGFEDVVTDDSGHGTAVMGVIGAVGNNGIGVAGTSWNVRILPIRACGGPLLDCDLFDEVEAIDVARTNGADIINMSIGGVGTISLEQNAVRDAYEAGIVIVSAAGNGNPGKLFVATGDPAQDKLLLYYPAALPEVIGVGAVGNDGLKADFSNYGEDILSIMAPGVDIVTTVPEDEVYLYTGDGPPYGLASGTSFATPMVSGVAALVLSQFPELTPAEVRARLELTAIPMAGPDANNNGINDYYSHGILNAYGALTQSTSVGNNYYRIGVAESPIIPGDVIVILQAFVAIDGSPTGQWTAVDSSDYGTFEFNPVETRQGFFIGHFHPGDVGSISVSVTGLSNGAPLPPVLVIYTLTS